MKQTMGKKHLFTLGSLLALAAVVVGYQKGAPKSQAEDKNVAAVRAVIEAQAAAWNRGDVTGYMEGYAKEETTTLVSGDTVTRGWQVVHDRYRARYDTREKMGTLAFSELEFKPLSEFYLMAVGRWQLTRAADTPHGRFTLIFRRTNAGWRIVHDHTSSE
jgi:ketosteroid isomerase-like protein